MAKESWCRHYRGMHLGDTCPIGVAFDSVKVTNYDRRFYWPCYDPEVQSACAKFEPYTVEEIAEEERLVSDFVRRMNDLCERRTDKCCQCGQLITSMQQVGRCVYARPCGCRLWQGKVPEAWK